MNWQSFGFDQAGDQTLSINGGSVTTSDSYQGGLLTKEIVLDSGGSTVSSTSMAYDSAGEATLTVEGGSITISDSYSGGLLTKEVVSDSSGTIVVIQQFWLRHAGRDDAGNQRRSDDAEQLRRGQSDLPGAGERRHDLEF